jgi:hypothetical protein
MSRTIRGSHAQPARALARALLLSTLVLLLPASARTQVPDANRWVTDGDVNVIVPWGNTVYVGGSFGYVGPNTGGWTEVNAAGHATGLLPRPDGEVTAMIPDGAGGWFIAGSFTHVAGIARPGLAQVTASGAVTAWSPSPAPTGNPTALEHAAARVFVATSDGELKAYDDATGAVVAGWTPAVSGLVTSLAVSGTTLFAGGDITFQITGTGTSGSGIAAIHTGSGGIAAWDPAPDQPVTKIKLDGRWLYVTGSFTGIGGESHAGLARVLVATLAFDPNWNPDVDTPVADIATAPSGLWIVGGFFLVGGEFRNHIAVLDTTSGATKPLSPDLTAFSSDVTGILVSGSNAYLALAPTLAFHLGGSARPLVIRVGTGDGKVDKFYRVLGDAAPTDVGALLHCMRLSPNGLVIAGRMITAGGRSQVSIAAFDRATGVPRSWDPALAVDEPFPTVPIVNAIVPTSHGIYIGGYFTHAGGALRSSVAELDSANAAARTWQSDLGPALTGAVGTAFSLALYQNRLMVGGSFNSVAGAPHTGLAQVDTSTGAPVAGWTCNVGGNVQCMLVRGTTVYVGGGLTDVGGQSRSNIGALNGTTGAALAWNPNVAGVAVDALAAQNDTLYIAGDYSQVAGQSRVCLAAVSATSGAIMGWSPTAFGPVRALVVDGSSLIVGGEFGFLNGQPKAFLARLDRFTGATGTGLPVPDDLVLALAADAGTLHIGGRFGKLDANPAANLARIGGADVAGPSVVVVAANGGESLVVGTVYRFEYTASDPSGVASVDVELSRAGSGGPWTLLAGGLRNSGHFEWTVTGPNVAANAFVRITARDFGGNTANDRSNAAFSIGAAIAGVDPLGEGPLVSLAIGPNPARLATNLRFTLRQPMRAGFRLLDIQGRQLWSSPEQAYDAGDHVVSCPLGDIRPGLYFLRFEHGREADLTRLAVVR